MQHIRYNFFDLAATLVFIFQISMREANLLKIQNILFFLISY